MLTFRLVEKKDDDLIYSIYRSTRDKELTYTNWTELQKRSFVTMQLMAQLIEYQKKYPELLQQIIVHNKKSIGRLYTWESLSEIKIIDISILPEYQRKGLGTKVLQQILNKAIQAEKKVNLHVVFSNPALKLYERLGFKKINTIMDRYYMVFSPLA
jgi:ribosomal protein S18 acetylase RimI-like enzyme